MTRHPALARRLALATALVLAAVALAAAQAPATAEPTARGPVYVVPGLSDAVDTACAKRAGLHYEQLYTGVSFQSTPGDGAPLGASGSVTAADLSGRVARFEACRADYPVDDSLVRADSVTQRRLLRVWYRASLLPCLRAHGFETPPLPSARGFDRRPYLAYDPWGAIPSGRLSLTDVETLQRECPAGPPAVLAFAETAPPPINPSWTYVSGADRDGS